MTDASEQLDHRDRSGRLLAFGVLLMVLAVAALGFAVLSPLALLAAPTPDGSASAAGADWRSVSATALTYVLAAALFFTLGLGSIRKLRWIAPVALSVGWIWLIAGTMALLMNLYMAPEMRASMEAMVEEQGQDENIRAMLETTLTVVMVLMLVFLGVFGVLLPGLMVLLYRSPHVRATCAAHWPDREAWTDRCPTRLVGLSLSLGLLAGVVFAALPYAAVPAFGVIITGLPAALIVLLLVAVCIWLAVLVAKRDFRGWIGTVVLLVLVTVGPLVNALIYSPAEQMEQMGMANEAYREMLSPELMAKTKVTMIAGFVIVALITIGYMLKIRPDFKRGQVSTE